MSTYGNITSALVNVPNSINWNDYIVFHQLHKKYLKVKKSLIWKRV